MDDQRTGAVLRAIRVQRRLRQQDVALVAGVSQSSVSRAERGHVAELTLGSLRSIAGACGVRMELTPRWRGGDLDRLLAAGHASMHDAVSRLLARYPSWTVVPEATYAFGPEHGVVDVLCWNGAAGVVLVVELKTQLVDINDLMGSMDRRRRLAPRMAAERGWVRRGGPGGSAIGRTGEGDVPGWAPVDGPDRRSADRRDDSRRAGTGGAGITVATWVLIAEGRTNRRRVAAHSSVLGRAFPGQRARLAAILRDPVREAAADAGPWDGLSFLSYGRKGNAKRTAGQVSRVRPRPGEGRRA
jgi:transcriptional regulator with XRE-family HTH domain